MVFDLFDKLLSFVLVPLMWLPPVWLLFLKAAITIFSIFLLGRLLKWIWDALPVV